MEIKRIAVLVLVLGLIALPNAVVASVQGGDSSSKSPYAGLSDDDLLFALNVAMAGEDPAYCQEMLPLLREMIKRGTFTGSVEKAGALTEVMCAREQRRWSDAYRLLLEAEKVGADDAGALGFELALYVEKYEDALDRLLSIAAEDDPAEVMSVYVEDVLFLKSMLSKDGPAGAEERMLQGLFDSPHFSEFSPRIQQPIAYSMLEMDAEKGRIEGAAGRLTYVKNPLTYIYLLSDRKFAPIWPMLEASVGPNLSAVSKAYVDETARRHAGNPSDDYAVQEYAHALLYAGRFEEVVALVDVKDVTNMTEQQGWALNVKAYALDALGRSAEADAIFDSIAAIPYKSGANDWLVSFTINRAYRLSELGRFEAALKANRLAESMPGSDFANMLTLAIKVCSLAGLDRRVGLKPLIQRVYDKRADSYANAAMAMLCVNEVDMAASIVREALADPESSGDMAKELQRPEFNLFYTRGALPVLYDALHDRPDIRAALNKAGQFIPDAYIPEAGLRRMKIELSGE